MKRSVLSCLVLLGLVANLRAADWPTWRGNARRSGTTTAELAGTLYPHWSLKLPSAVPAWPNEPRLQFDAAYEPIVAGNLLIVGSPNDGSVTAFDVETGQQRWKFYSNGPVRFAPIADRGRVYFGSDDGRMYCVSATNGEEQWQVRIAPAEHQDLRHLGNGRLISLWPVRGGPVLADKTLYCAAGVWPTMGVFVAAIDAASGKVVWRNDELNRIDQVRLDHNYLEPSGLSPQGYLAVEAETLVVPNGRSLPALLDRQTGKLRHYIQGYRNGDCRVTVQSPYAFVGDSGVIDLRTGREVGARWASAGREAPKAWDPSRPHLFEGPFFPYKLSTGCSWRSVLSEEAVYDISKGVLTAHDARNAKLTEYSTPGFGSREVQPLRWDPPQLWSLDSGLAVKSSADAALMQAGRRLYVHAYDTLAAVETSGGAAPRMAWKLPLAGKPASIVSGADRLFVVAQDGTITCLGAAERQFRQIAQETKPLAVPPDEWKARAVAMLKLSHASHGEGYCVVLGLGAGHLARALLQAEPRLKLIALDADRAKVDAFRTELSAAGLYGSRAEALVGAPWEFPLPPYLASLIVSEDPQAIASAVAQPAAALFERLRPYGGVLFLAATKDRDSFEPWASAMKPAGASFEHVDEFLLLRRDGPLHDSAAWTHECADPTRSFFSRDRLVKPPFAVLWYGDGADYGFWKRKDYNIGIKPQVVKGRVIAFQHHTNSLAAYDVYTGRQLWLTPVGKLIRYASLPDGVYAVSGDKCLVIDPDDGSRRAEFTFRTGEGRKDAVSDLRVSDQIILIGVVPAELRKGDRGVFHSSALVALDRRSGQQLWMREARVAFSNSAISLGGGKVWCTDAILLDDVAKADRRGESGPMPASVVLALDELTGVPLWEKEVNYERHAKNKSFANRHYDDWLGYVESQGIVLTGKLDYVVGLSAADGSELWRQAPLRGQPMILRGDTFMNQSGQLYDTRTGQTQGPPVDAKKGACNYYVANEFCLFGREHSASYTDLSTGEMQGLYAVRSGCSNSMIAADGLLNVPNFAVGCICNYPMQTSFALFHSPDAGVWFGSASQE